MVPVGVAARVAEKEFEARERNLTGIFGDDLKQKAETLGLANIAYGQWQAKGKVWRVDLLTGEVFIEPKELNRDERAQLRSWRARLPHYNQPGEKPPFAAQMAQYEARVAIHRQTI
jgi:hypothetical protein